MLGHATLERALSSCRDRRNSVCLFEHVEVRCDAIGFRHPLDEEGTDAFSLMRVH